MNATIGKCDGWEGVAFGDILCSSESPTRGHVRAPAGLALARRRRRKCKLAIVCILEQTMPLVLRTQTCTSLPDVHRADLEPAQQVGTNPVQALLLDITTASAPATSDSSLLSRLLHTSNHPSADGEPPHPAASGGRGQRRWRCRPSRQSGSQAARDGAAKAFAQCDPCLRRPRLQAAAFSHLLSPISNLLFLIAVVSAICHCP